MKKKITKLHKLILLFTISFIFSIGGLFFIFNYINILLGTKFYPGEGYLLVFVLITFYLFFKINFFDRKYTFSNKSFYILFFKRIFIFSLYTGIMSFISIFLSFFLENIFVKIINIEGFFNILSNISLYILYSVILLFFIIKILINFTLLIKSTLEEKIGYKFILFNLISILIFWIVEITLFFYMFSNMVFRQ